MDELRKAAEEIATECGRTVKALKTITKHVRKVARLPLTEPDLTLATEAFKKIAAELRKNAPVVYKDAAETVVLFAERMKRGV